MMRPAAFIVALTIGCALPIAAQEKVKETKGKPPKTLSLSGCVVRSENPPGRFTLEDANEGKYRLTGVNVGDYVGQRVSIAGGVVETKRLTIKTGLTPNANVAAQASSMDPARIAVANAGGAAGPGMVDLPEFKVRSVRPVSGSCPD
jgi:hypothetical protein